ncbi:MAG: excinuclease ABC subunit UvrA [Candidatus Dojkabacteria bacterium]|nr:MAG: excinuclease ABC subunit UvrA [Candidatus Dojkabacteria bacterium]
MDKIIVTGANENNLKNVSLEIPKNKYVVFTGLSGSGKSSLAMDTLYAEGQRKYVESLSSYARQFLGELRKPDVEKIEGLSPAIAIDQKTVSHNPRSTVGTITEIYDYLRLLYARVGIAHCPNCGRVLTSQTIDEIVDGLLASIIENLKNDSIAQRFTYRAMISGVPISGRKGEYEQVFLNLRKQGWNLVRVDDSYYDLQQSLPQLDKYKAHDIEVIVDTMSISKSVIGDETQLKELRTRLFQSIEAALKIQPNFVRVLEIRDPSPGIPARPTALLTNDFSVTKSCKVCGISVPEFEPRDFSFNSPHGACIECSGLGVIKRIDPEFVIDKKRSIVAGGIAPYAKLMERDSYFRRLLEMVADAHAISMHTPIENLTQGKIDTLLFGTGEQKYKITYYSSQDGTERTLMGKYEGIIPNLERRYKETQSEYIRTEIEKYMTSVVCPECNGTRLKRIALAVKIGERNIAELGNLTIGEFFDAVEKLPKTFDNKATIISQAILREIQLRSKFLLDVGLDYLTVNRSANTLSGGESQRIRLASQIGTGLSGVIYVLDEPSIGLHARDQHRLINTLKNLRDLGNTVVVVEHDKDTMMNADMVVDFGPGAGDEGGRIIAKGTPEDLMADKNSVTGPYLSGKASVSKNVAKLMKAIIEKKQPGVTPPSRDRFLEIKGATTHNLKDVSVKFPLGKFVNVTGVSGSGKSSLVVESLLPALKKSFGQKIDSADTAYKNVFIAGAVDKVLYIDQSPIGRTPRSNPATYTKVFDDIRELFAQTKEAKVKGYTASRFSFNLKGGRCEACKGEGKIKIEMQFMPDVYIDCDVCHGKRYVSEVLQVKFKDKNISDVLDMPISQAREFFKDIPLIREKLEVLVQVGLGYLTLGQSAPLLSGGEAQRVKLASELSKRSTGKTVYILDEPTTGLHFVDIEKLIAVLKTLVHQGNTVIVIEHNLDFIMEADWVIDVGPEGGDKGGNIVFEGTVSQLMHADTWTGRMLKEYTQQ